MRICTRGLSLLKSGSRFASPGGEEARRRELPQQERRRNRVIVTVGGVWVVQHVPRAGFTDSRERGLSLTRALLTGHLAYTRGTIHGEKRRESSFATREFYITPPVGTQQRRAYALTRARKAHVRARIHAGDDEGAVRLHRKNTRGHREASVTYFSSNHFAVKTLSGVTRYSQWRKFIGA